LNKIIASIMPNWLAFLNQIKWTEIALTHLEQNAAAEYYHDIADGIATNFLVDHVKMCSERVHVMFGKRRSYVVSAVVASKVDTNLFEPHPSPW
jgi:hypothetical protein